MVWLAVKYAFFAVVATICNLGSQRLVLATYPEAYGFAAALVVGTGVGLVVKFLLDKRWIFQDPTQKARDEVQKFSLYTFTGIGTTLIFWASESLFWALWQTTTMREIGAVIGLTIGYVVKFNLDKRYVFPGALEAGSTPKSNGKAGNQEG